MLSLTAYIKKCRRKGRKLLTPFLKNIFTDMHPLECFWDTVFQQWRVTTQANENPAQITRDDKDTGRRGLENVGSKKQSLLCVPWACYIMWLSCVSLKLITQKMDHGKLNPLSPPCFSLSGGSSSSRWGCSRRTKGLRELRWPLVVH